MKVFAFLLSALLFSCTALSHPYRHVTAHGHVRVVQQLPHQNRRVVARHANYRRVAVVVPIARPAYRRVAVVTYRPHYNRTPRAVVYGRHVHRHYAHCRH